MHGLTFAVITWGLFSPSKAHRVESVTFPMILICLTVGSVLLSLWANAELKSFLKYNDKWVFMSFGWLRLTPRWTPKTEPSATSSTDAEEEGVQIGDHEHVPGSSEKQSGEKVEDKVN